MRLLAVVAAGMIGFLGCAARQRVSVLEAGSSSEGTTSVRVLEDESAKSQAVDTTMERITAAFASDENKLPEYPPYALKAGCQQGVVPIRLVIGVDGNVARVTSVPTRPVAQDQCHSAFWAATTAAVQRWRFSPAFRLTPKPGPDVDGDGKSDYSRWEQTAVMIYLDFEFTFRVIGGKGQVLSR